MNQLTRTYNQNHKVWLVRLVAGIAFVAAVVFLPATAHADSTATYQISGNLASSGTFSGTIEFDHSTSTGLTTLINSSLTVDGISFSCDGATGGNQCLVYAPVGPDFFQVLSGAHLLLLEWNPISLAGPYPSTLTFITGYCTTCSGAGSDWVTGGTGTYVTAPENSTIVLFGAGLLAIALLSRRRFSSRPTA
jgi:hypothetical protein